MFHSLRCNVLCDSALHIPAWGARWPGGIVTDSGARYQPPHLLPEKYW